MCSKSSPPPSWKCYKSFFFFFTDSWKKLFSQVSYLQARPEAGKTKGGSITVLLTSCLTGLDFRLVCFANKNKNFEKNSWFQTSTSQTGGQQDSGTSSFRIPCRSLFARISLCRKVLLTINGLSYLSWESVTKKNKFYDVGTRYSVRMTDCCSPSK